jgi:hypothetical protein
MNHHKKITPKREGPFEIDEVLGPVTYRLKLPESWKIHNVFHATLLRPYIENEVYGNNYPRPLPELLEGEEVYEVCQGFTKSHSGQVQMDSGRRDLKDILIANPPRTTSDPSWEASAW